MITARMIDEPLGPDYRVEPYNDFMGWQGWTVTHRPSGMCVNVVYLYEAIIRIAKALERNQGGEG